MLTAVSSYFFSPTAFRSPPPISTGKAVAASFRCIVASCVLVMAVDYGMFKCAVLPQLAESLSSTFEADFNILLELELEELLRGQAHRCDMHRFSSDRQGNIKLRRGSQVCFCQESCYWASKLMTLRVLALARGDVKSVLHGTEGIRFPGFAQRNGFLYVRLTPERGAAHFGSFACCPRRTEVRPSWLPILTNKRHKMNELTVVDKANQWRRMKEPCARFCFVADHEAGVQHGPGRVLRLVRPGAAARLHQGHRERLARIPGGTRPGFVQHHCPHVGDPEAGGGGDRQRPAGAGIGRRNPAREERQVHRRARRELAFPQASPGAAERARYNDDEGTAGPGHHRRAPGMRPAAVRGGGAHHGARAAARWPVVHRRSVRQAQPRSDHPDAGLGETGHRRLDRSGRRGGRLRLPARHSRRSGAGRRAVREGCLAAPPAVRRGCRRPWYCAP